MKVIAKLDNKNRIVVDMSGGGNEIESVLPSHTLRDTQILYEITKAYIEKQLTLEEAKKKLKTSFDESKSQD